jgi:hypothetical protein
MILCWWFSRKLQKTDFRFRRVQSNLINFSEFEKFPIRKPLVTEAIFSLVLPLQRMLKIADRGKNIELQCIFVFWPRPFPVFYAAIDLCILAPENCEGSILYSKWLQCPYLYWTYEATYGLKFMVCRKQISAYYNMHYASHFLPKPQLLAHMLLHKFNIMNECINVYTSTVGRSMPRTAGNPCSRLAGRTTTSSSGRQGTNI